MVSIVCGVGVNDSETPVSWHVDGKKVWCPYYSRWCGVITRCYDGKDRHKSYWDCSVHPDWIYFSNFRDWMKGQEWRGLQLDKDILVKDNREYGPENCAFVPDYLNGCIILSTQKVFNVELPLGVNYFKKFDHMINELKKPYLVRCPRTDKKDKSKHVGYFSTPEEAHRAYQIAKYNQLNEYLDMYLQESCFREDVYQSMRKRAYQLLIDNINGVETKTI